jgi:transcriptional regulator with XRE-family HTH domain
MPKMDYGKLLGRMREFGLTQKSVASAIGISRQQLNNKLNGRSPFSQRDIKEICNLLEIPLSNVGTYFFTEVVTKTQQQKED